MLELKNVTKKFFNNVAVKNLSFKIDNGKILGIVGRNGAGKSTTFRMILNIIDPDSGEILYDGNKITSKIMDKIGYLPEEGSLLSELTVLELCEYYGSLKLIDENTVIKNLLYWLEEFNILEYLNKKIKDLSKGNRQKIQFIVSILHNPELIILDEPFSGLDPISVEELKKAILKLKENGKTIIFSSHMMEHIEMLCEELIIINKGETLLKGDIKEIINNYEINGKKNNSLNEIFIDIIGGKNE
ncbi:MAG: ATP-binding cassette domain-containing protein [Clostridia bacterium]|nr:ATP-binding cassette domain-containing protein [Clostridia bacterium]